MNTYENVSQVSEMRFISTCESVSAVWELMAYEPINNPTFTFLQERGLIFMDRDGQWWHIERLTHNTVEQARRYAGMAGLDYEGSAIVVIDLTQTTCDNGTCKCCY